MHDPIAYTYESGVHCPPCTFHRFGRDVDGFPPADATDTNGNEIGAIAPWDQWYDTDVDCDALGCDDCFETVATAHADPHSHCPEINA